MPKTLYRLRTGKITRKNITGGMETHKAPYDFVPSPTELSANRFRMSAVGSVPDNSDEAKVAELNTNQTNPTAKKQIATAATQPEDIRKLDLAAALELVKTAKDEVMLDKYLLQESSNKPRVRKTVLVAIEAQRDVIGAAGPVIEGEEVGVVGQ